MTDVQNDVEALDRVLFRLANVDDERMLQVLQSLLPQLLTLFPRTLDSPLRVQLKDKILQVISHVRTRLVLLSNPTLPLDAICQVLVQPNLSIFSHNLALLFLELGFPAASIEQQTHVLTLLFNALPSFSATQQETFFRLLVRGMPTKAFNLSSHKQQEEEEKANETFTPDRAFSSSIDVMLDFLLDLVLYEFPGAISPDTSVFGLLPPRIERLKRVKVLEGTRESLYERQLDALKLVKELTIASTRKLPLYVAGSASCHHLIKTFSDDQLSRVMKYDDKALEDGHGMRRLMTFMLGSHVAATAGAFDDSEAFYLENRARFKDASILKSLTLLSASRAATNTFPCILQVLCHLIFGTDMSRPSTMAFKIKVASLDLCQWTLQQCELSLLETCLAPVLLPTLLRQLTSSDTETEDESEDKGKYRQGIYLALSILATRTPALVATSEEAFQLLLVHALDHDQDSEAVKTLTSFGSAYAAKATSEVRQNVIHELLGLLNGSKLYQPRYTRVRQAIASWCVDFLSISVPEEHNVALRFAVMRLKADADEETRRLADKALFTPPLPSIRALSQSLQAAFGSKDLKKTSHLPASAVSTCLDFCLQILEKADQKNDHPDDWKCVIEYLTHTLVEPSATTASAIPLMLETAAKVLVTVSHLNAECVSAVLACHVTELLDVSAKSHDRAFLLNLASLVSCLCRSKVFSAREMVSTFIVNGTVRLDDCRRTDMELAGVVYLVGSAINCIASNELQQSIIVSNGEEQLIVQCFQQLSDRFHRHVATFACSTSDRALNEQFFTVARSLMDGIGLCGVLPKILASSVGLEWLQLKIQTLKDFQQVLGWDSQALGSDEKLQSNVRAIKRVAIENLGHIRSDLPASVSLPWSNAVNNIFNALLEMEHDDLELDFCIGEALVALGNNAILTSETASNDSTNLTQASVIFERIWTEFATSRQRKKRWKATILLLCMCAAGFRASTSWQQVFQSPSRVLNVHDFFVSMLNDSNQTIVESALKGLAYLRHCAPTEAVGSQLSDRLFRHLRCFRALKDGGDSEQRHEEATVVVENAAYREMSNIAADVGEPELLYTFLYLSTNEAIWATFTAVSMRASPFSFGTIDKDFRASIVAKATKEWRQPASSLPSKLLPWLFLLKFHSKSTIVATMSHLWTFFNGLEAPTTHWLLLFHFALSRLESARNFKYREAACGALCALLGDAQGSELNGDLRRLWRAAARAVDDVMEVVAGAGIKLFRAVSDTSVRLIANDVAWSPPVLDFLLDDGIVSQNATCQSLSLDVLLRLLTTLKAQELAPRIARLILQLLEYLSSLELPALQYAQFHVDKKEQLERLRVSMSSAGPVGQLLAIATKKLLEVTESSTCLGIVQELVPGLVTLLKTGVGLNTRVGTATFVVTLATELPYELRKSNGAEMLLRRVLIPYVEMKTRAENEHYDDEASRYGGHAADASASMTSGLKEGLVIQSYCRAAAALCPLVDRMTTKEYVERGIFATNSKTASPFSSRFLLISALATTEVVKKVPPIDTIAAWYCTHVFPAAFIGQFAVSTVLQKAWKSVLEELPPSILYASTSFDALLTASTLFLSHPAWDTRRQAACALQAIFECPTYRSNVSEDQLSRLWNELLAYVPGRLWRGKGVILDTIVSLAAVKLEKKRVDYEEWMEMVSLVLVGECSRAWKHEDEAYLESAIVNLGNLSALIPAEAWHLRQSNICALRTLFGDWTMDVSTRTVPPLLVKCVFEALTRMWSISTAQEGAETITWLCTCLELPSLTAWSIRKATFQTLAAVVKWTSGTELDEKKNQIVDRMVEICCGPFGVADTKHSMVRAAAAAALAALLERGKECSNLAFKLVIQQERVVAAIQMLLMSEEASDQQAACTLKSQLPLSV